MALTVVVRSGDIAVPASITFDAPRIVIGRSRSSEVLLPDPSVSQRHASIRQRGTDYVVVDEGSTNGTFVGPVRLSPHAPRILRSGDLLRVGRIWLEVRIEQVPVAEDPQLATREIALALVASALGAGGEPLGVTIRVAKGPDSLPVLVLTDADRDYVIGRGAGVDLDLGDEDLSRRHVEVGRRGLDLVVRDLGSKNGSVLEGEKLEAGREKPWPPGVRLVVGQTELVYEDPVRKALEELEAVPDERMRADDSIDPPKGVTLPESEPASSVGARGSERDRVLAPIAELPKSKPVVKRGGGVGLLDAVVALIALLVLGLSLFGLWLLFRT